MIVVGGARVVHRPQQAGWDRNRDDALDQLRAELERGGLSGARPQSPALVPQPAVSLAVLQLLDGTLVGMLSCSEEAGVATIGRGRDATIRVHDPYVSRLHATVRWDAEGGTHILLDHGAQNGTYVNGRRITGPTRMLDGARIRMGTTELLYIRQFD
ncbi:MAG: hypothetical protein DCC58_14340 [Chloroflexi bacterium]|nr:MAG: hypothetical protein DCC58_14340 [Chloroflexota bacterium]